VWKAALAREQKVVGKKKKGGLEPKKKVRAPWGKPEFLKLSQQQQKWLKFQRAGPKSIKKLLGIFKNLRRRGNHKNRENGS